MRRTEESLSLKTTATNTKDLRISFFRDLF
jgi:hypothetical protein